MFDPGGSQGRRLPVFGNVLCGEIMCIGATVDDLQRFLWRLDDPGLKNLQERYGRNTYAVRTAVNR